MSKRMTDQRIYEIKRWLSDEEIPWDEVPIAPTKKELLCALKAEREYWHSNVDLLFYYSDIVKEAKDHIAELVGQRERLFEANERYQNRIAELEAEILTLKADFQNEAILEGLLDDIEFYKDSHE